MSTGTRPKILTKIPPRTLPEIHSAVLPEISTGAISTRNSLKDISRNVRVFFQKSPLEIFQNFFQDFFFHELGILEVFSSNFS